MFEELVGLSPAICWALSPIFYSRGLRNLSPVVGNFLRALPATIITFVSTTLILGIDKTFYLPTNAYIVLLLSGVIGLGLGDLLYLLSIKRIGPSPSITITSTYPLLTILISFLFLGENITFYVLAGTVLVVLGITIISRKNGGRRVDLVGIGLATLAALLWSISITLVGSISGSAHPLTENLWRTVGYILAAILILFFNRKNESFRLERTSIVHITLGGVVALNLGWASYIYSIELIGLSKATTLSSVSPIFTATTEFLLERKFRLNVFLGTFLTTIGIVLVTL